MRIDGDGRVRWRNNNLGLDGIQLNSVSGNTIVGTGEWDPPGGWKPFMISATTGEATR